MNTQRVLTRRQGVAGEFGSSNMLVDEAMGPTAAGSQSPVWNGVSTLQAVNARLENLAEQLSVLLGPVLIQDEMACVKSDVRPTPGHDRPHGVCDLQETLLRIADTLMVTEERLENMRERLAI